MNEFPVYPGTYIPLVEVQSLVADLKNQEKREFAVPPMNMDECGGLYRIEIGLPGILREDIYISAKENLLSVIVVHQTNDTAGRKALQVHELESSCFERHIFLPVNADTEFISAELRNGLLCIRIPKTNSPAKSTNHIAVY